MARAAGPMTPAERQRAYRERHKNVIRLPGASEGGGGGDGGDEDESITLAQLNARMRAMAARAFDEVGGTEYLKRVATKAPGTFLRFAAQFVSKDEGFTPGAFNIFVQKLEITQAQPVAGVISSPVAAHVAQGAQRLLPSVGIVIDVPGHETPCDAS